MHKFFSFIKEFQIPKKEELKNALASFSAKEFYLFTTIFIVALVSLIIILNSLNNKFLVDVPVKGGSITEGIIGMPTLVNPILAVSDADKDLSALIYSGLMRKQPDGSFIPDLAESYTVTPDGLNYTFILKKNARFHDGTKLNADDVVFTINKIKDPIIKSPRKIGWDGITVEKIDNQTVSFKLKQPYISFIDNMTIGIMPMHIWKDVKDAEFSISPFNIKAVGSGPYKIKSVLKNKDGIPEKYTLNSFANFTLGNPNIKKFEIISFSNEKDLVQAILDKSIDQASGISPKNAVEIEKSSHTINTASTPRIFGIFYNNANNKIFADSNVIKAFNYALNKEDLINQVLFGYGSVIDSPIPESIFKDNKTTIKEDISKANELLEKSGWTLKEDGTRSKGGITTVTKTRKVGKKTITEKVKVNNGPIIKLEFSLTTGDTPELKAATEIIKSQLSRIGVSVNTEKVYEMGPLNQIIRNREYEALFFGQVINHESDLFSFWHSSQRKDPGLNISMYSNSKVDKILEDAQKIISAEERASKYKIFAEEFNKDIPALLIYSPKYIYATTNELNNINIKTLLNPSDRFASIYTWYANKDHVWKIFTK
jgi:peptide/nickel transport system substrate-binding protein